MKDNKSVHKNKIRTVNKDIEYTQDLIVVHICTLLYYN